MTTNHDEITKSFKNHFIPLCRNRKKVSFEIILGSLNEGKTEAMDDVNEVLKAINKLNAESSPVSDGTSSNFYKMFKREIMVSINIERNKF